MTEEDLFKKFQKLFKAECNYIFNSSYNVYRIYKVKKSNTSNEVYTEIRITKQEGILSISIGEYIILEYTPEIYQKNNSIIPEKYSLKNYNIIENIYVIYNQLVIKIILEGYSLY